MTKLWNERVTIPSTLRDFSFVTLFHSSKPKRQLHSKYKNGFLGKASLLVGLLVSISLSVEAANFYSCPTVNSWTNDPLDCSAGAIASAGLPGVSDDAFVRDDWYNSAFSYNLANLAWGMDGVTFFSVKPRSLTIQSGGRVVFNSTSYAGLPAGFDLITQGSGIFASYTALAVINSISNDGQIHLFGSITNGNNIAGAGVICYAGNFENSTLGGEINGAFKSATEATLVAGFFTSFDAGLGGNCGSAGVLPVELIDFQANKNESGVLLEWTTGSEINASYYDIEFSHDGYSWETIDYVSAVGNTHEVSHYSFYDNRFLGVENSVYYRLKMVDDDGKYAYSKVRVLGNEQNPNFDTFFASDQLNVTIESEDLGDLKIVDMHGRVVYTSQNHAKERLVIGGQNFDSMGLYTAIFTTGSKVSTSSFLVNKI